MTSWNMMPNGCLIRYFQKAKRKQKRIRGALSGDWAILPGARHVPNCRGAYWLQQRNFTTPRKSTESGQLEITGVGTAKSIFNLIDR
ncbi:hypothetical protein [Methanobrevibacter sp.]|uniref:hypothetical protein n=1 Tax=Methanobrevibacter sp. TaxID=66852 RepID=UPI0025D22A2C|nr:hypothetical protein [Methanobrevibacter sp.]MBQ2666232.1 hypothetical protein [Methanobrevibacter sp.]